LSAAEVEEIVPVEVQAEPPADVPEAAPAVEEIAPIQEEPAAEDYSHDPHSGEGIV
jgi:hypothetical protein